MKTGLSQQQTQQQRQVQTTSAVQVMLSNIIEMPLANFEQHVENEINTNEALEVSDDDSELTAGYADEENAGDDFGVRDSHTSDDDFNDFVTIDQVPEDLRERYNDEMRSGNGRSQYDGDTERQIVDTGATSYDDIIAQIGEHELTPDEVTVMTYLIGSLDERGYLTKDNDTLIDELAFQEYVDIDAAHLQRLVDLLQTFEPRGIGAHDLRECLLLQMQCEPEEKARLPLVKRLAHKIVRDMFDELCHAHWKKIQDVLDVDDETIVEIQHVFHHLNPTPGRSLNDSTHSTAPTVIPDFRLYVDKEGNIVIHQNRGNVHDLKVSSSYSDTVNAYREAQERARAEGRELTLNRRQEDEYSYAAHKVEAAKAFIESIKRRRITLQMVMESIARCQSDFFLNDDDELQLRPMILRDVAEQAGVDISTVSRAVNSKFVQTDFGTYSLKYFFGSEFVNSEGENVSQRQALNAIKSIIEAEDPHRPLSDQKITTLLAEQGLTIARRTVAKYRERLGYPTSSLRRR